MRRARAKRTSVADFEAGVGYSDRVERAIGFALRMKAPQAVHGHNTVHTRRLTMRPILAAFAVALVVTPVAASDQTDVMAIVHRFIDALDRGDVKTACSTCATPSSIVDEFPPYGWQGASACTDWATDFDSFNKKNGITDPAVTLGKPRHVDVSADRAYAVVPATFSYNEKGKKMAESGSVFTAALQKASAGWVITGWAWSKH